MVASGEFVPGLASLSGYILLAHPTHKGYLRVHMSRNGDGRLVSIHLLVAESFLGPRPNGLQINHIDSDKTNNRPGNLEYITPKANMIHATRHGRPGVSKLDYSGVRRIRRLLAEGMTYKQVAARMGVCSGTVYMVKSKRYWGHVED